MYSFDLGMIFFKSCSQGYHQSNLLRIRTRIGLCIHGFITPKDCSVQFQICCFPLFLCIDHWGRLSCLFLLFFGTLHSDAYIFPILLCFSLLFFSQLLVRPPQTAILLFCILLSWGWSSSVSCTMSRTSIHSSSGPLSIGSNPLNLFLTSTV